MSNIIHCAHRGASALAPENTLSAIQLAADLGATMVEVDLQQTADDELVLFHDDKLNRTSNGNGPLWKKTLKELQLLDAGSWFSPQFTGEKIPTLESLISTMGNQLNFNIELKLHGHERNLEQLVAGKLQKLDCANSCLITSIDHQTINRLQNIAPHLKTGYIIEKGHWKDSLLQAKVEVLSLEKTLITAERVQRAHAAGKEIHAWTVNKESEMKNLQAMGVDAFISNHPDKVTNFLHKN